jgi:hypothetical protein
VTTADIKVHSTHHVFLKEGGEIDAHLRRVVLRGLRELDITVPDNATVRIGANASGMSAVIVSWSEETTP